MIVNETQVTAIRNQDVKFEFLVKKGAYRNTRATFFIGDHPNDVKLLLENEKPTSLATMLFGDRLQASFLKDKFASSEYPYVVTITDLQYNYTGSYYFEIIFFKRDHQKYLNRTIKLNVTGRKCILCD